LRAVLGLDGAELSAGLGANGTDARAEYVADELALPTLVTLELGLEARGFNAEVEESKFDGEAGAGAQMVGLGARPSTLWAAVRLT
jgi:hypothetical protein